MAITEEQRTRKRRRKTSHVKRVDRISDLPDPILSHILSFLPTKSAVATTALAKRWRFLWPDVTNLDFDRENQDIINRVLLQIRAHTLTTLRLNYETRYSSIQLEKWINFRNVQKLDLYIRSRDYYHQAYLLPPCVFNCKALVELRLDSCGVIPASVATCLPRLKKLQLLFLQYEDDESLPHLLSGCPVLEELDLQLERDRVYCNVSSLTIKRLKFNFIIELNGRVERLDINTPALEYLKINDFFCDHININSGVLTSLIEADIRLDGNGYKKLDFRSMLDFFDELRNAKCLKLDLSYCLRFVDSVPSAWTTSFRNLIKLELAADCRFLSMFLKNADNLEILIFYSHAMKPCEEVRGWTEPSQKVATCLLSRLRIVKFAYFKGKKKKHELEIIRYLLRNARVLERMEIAYGEFLDSSKAKVVDMFGEISRFQRGSTSCEVAFVRWL